MQLVSTFGSKLRFKLCFKLCSKLRVKLCFKHCSKLRFKLRRGGVVMNRRTRTRDDDMRICHDRVLRALIIIMSAANSAANIKCDNNYN